VVPKIFTDNLATAILCQSVAFSLHSTLNNKIMNSQQLEDRLIEFTILILEIADEAPPTKAGNHISGQLIRSGTSVSLHYGEVRGAESKRDFVHKLSVVLKELRETLICLKIMHKAKLYKHELKVLRALKENNELISIFVKSIETAGKKS
jgi:four helix bundle protein